MKWEAMDYQCRMMAAIVGQERIGLFLGMGLGKTVITLSALKRLKLELGVIRRTLVIAPLRVAETVWTAEAAKWDHLADLKIAKVLGSPSRRYRALHSEADIYVINRENVSWLIDLCARRWPFDCVVIDELSSFKSAHSKRFKSLRKVIGGVSRVIGLTGTPSPNGVMDLWSQVYLLDLGERLYKTLGQFRTRWFDYNPYKHSWKPKEGAVEAIYARLENLCISMSASDYLQLPELVLDDVPVEMGLAARRQYDALKREYVIMLRQGDVTAVNAAALVGKLLQICNGAVYMDNDRGAEQIHTAKLDALAETLEQLNGEPCLIFYSYRHDVPGIVQAVGDGARVLKKAQDVEDWNAGRLRALIAHPASAGFGLNLQAGGRHVVFYGLPWSLEQYQQSIARLHRQGQDRPVTVHRLLCVDSMDERVRAVLDAKEDGQAALLDALKAELA